MQEYLSLGSIVILKGDIKKVLIVSRGIRIKKDNKTIYYDYGTVFYPEGLIHGNLLYFNHDVIDVVISKGYTDESESKIQRILNANTYASNTREV